MQAVDTEVDGRALAGFDDFLLDLLAHFCNYFLDACGVDTAVGHELMQGQTGDFAAHGVEARQHDGFGGVVHYDLDAGGGFEGADVAAFAAYDAAFDFIGIDVEHCHGVLDGCFGGYTLYGLHHDAASFFVGRQFGVVHDVVDV